MRYRYLPNTDIKISIVAMGTWTLAGDFTWGPQEESDSIASIHAALDAGITFFDTAELYGQGRSEEILGRTLRGRRDQAVLASKASQQHLAPADLRQACHNSLRRLQTDNIDLYQIHWPNRTVPWQDTWVTLQQLQQEGKIKAIGVSNFGPGDLANLLAIGKPVTNQVPYNLLFRAVEFDIMPACQDANIELLCYSPLAQGVLTGKYATGREVPDRLARTRHFSSDRAHTRHDEPGCESETFAAITEIRRLCQELGQPMGQVALAWLLHQPNVGAVIPGARRPDQVRFNAAAADLSLPIHVLEALEKASASIKRLLGPNPDMWQSESRFR